MSKTKDLATELTSMANAAGITEMSTSELKNYVDAIQDRLLESGDPNLTALVHVMRRARERAAHEKDIPIGKLLSEEMEKEKIGLKAKK
jgi:hypothetical protein